MSLTGQPLFVLLMVATVTCPLLFVLSLHRVRRVGWVRSATQLVTVLTCQLLAVSTVFLWVNNQYGFYNSWSDLFGRSGGTATITTNDLNPGTGTIQTLNVPGSPATDHQVVVWLPPQYNQPHHDHTSYPVLLVLPGQPSTPDAMFAHFNFGTTATAAIDSGQVKPFIAVLPPLMTNPPRDTECTNIPGGPQAETWLSHDVPTSIQTQLRTDGSPWTALGWSTGGYCATKLLLHQPQQFGKAASFGGYYQPLTDHTTGNLFDNKIKVRNYNSPTWLYHHGGLHGRQLLVVSGRQDHESYPSTASFLTATHGDRGISSLIFPTGGHNYHNYSRYLPQTLQWLQSSQPPSG